MDNETFMRMITAILKYTIPCTDVERFCIYITDKQKEIFHNESLSSSSSSSSSLHTTCNKLVLLNYFNSNDISTNTQNSFINNLSYEQQNIYCNFHFKMHALNTWLNKFQTKSPFSNKDVPNDSLNASSMDENMLFFTLEQFCDGFLESMEQFQLSPLLLKITYTFNPFVRELFNFISKPLTSTSQSSVEF